MGLMGPFCGQGRDRDTKTLKGLSQNSNREARTSNELFHRLTRETRRLPKFDQTDKENQRLIPQLTPQLDQKDIDSPMFIPNPHQRDEASRQIMRPSHENI